MDICEQDVRSDCVGAGRCQGAKISECQCINESMNDEFDLDALHRVASRRIYYECSPYGVDAGGQGLRVFG